MPTLFDKSTFMLPCYLMDDEEINNRMTKVEDKLDGTIGGNIFEHFAVLFNHTEQKCTLLVNGNLSEETLGQYGFIKSQQGVPFSWTEADARPVLSLWVDGQTLPVMLSTTSIATKISSKIKAAGSGTHVPLGLGTWYR